MPQSREALGLVEFNSIAAGVQAMDEMIKRAEVELVIGRTICSGKYLAIVRGDVGAVSESVEEGRRIGGVNTIDGIVIPNVHPQVFPAISAVTSVDSIRSLGVVETFSAPSAIEAADHSVKAADVQLIEIRIANGIGGKTFYTLTGLESAVRAAVGAGVDAIEDSGLLMKWIVIPSPDPLIHSTLL